MLAQYIADVQDHLNDSQGQFYPESRLTRFINKSRRRVAGVSGCLRVCPRGVWTQKGQEIYRFTDWKPQIQAELPGAASLFAIRTVSIAIGPGGWKPMWSRIPWSDFQARFRIYNGSYYGVVSEPGWWAQYGMGDYGSLYLAPIPSQRMPMDIDASVIPTPLLTDQDPEPIPYPWTDAVSYWAAVLALLGQQRAQDASAMTQLFKDDMPMCASIVCPVMLPSPYRAVLRSA